MVYRICHSKGAPWHPTPSLKAHFDSARPSAEPWERHNPSAGQQRWVRRPGHAGVNHGRNKVHVYSVPTPLKQVSGGDPVPGRRLCLCACLPVWVFSSLRRPSSLGSLSLGRPHRRASPLRDPAGVGRRGRPPFPGGPGSRPGRGRILRAGGTGKASRWRGRRSPGGTREGSAPAARPQGSPRPGPASPARRRGGGGPPRPARPGPGARDGTCCVLKSQPRQQRRAACSVMAAEGAAARPSVRPSRGVSVAALQRPETPGPPLAPPGRTPGPESPAG